MVRLCVVYHDLSILQNPQLATLPHKPGSEEREAIEESYHRHVPYPISVPARKNTNTIVRGKRIYSPHYSNYYYWFRTLFADGMVVRKIILYPPDMLNDIRARISEAYRVADYWEEKIGPNVVEWLRYLRDRYGAKISTPKLEVLILAKHIDMSREELYRVVKRYMQIHYPEFYSAETFGTRSRAVSLLSRLFGVPVRELMSTDPAKVASVLWSALGGSDNTYNI